MALVVGALLGVAGRASAETESQSIGVDYSAPSSCPEREELLAAVRARVAKVNVEPADAVRTFLVRVEGREGRYFGTITIRDRRSEREQKVRELSGANCTELVGALGFFVALSLEPAEKDPEATLSAKTDTPPPGSSAKAPAERSGRPTPSSWSSSGGGAPKRPVLRPLRVDLGTGLGLVSGVGEAPFLSWNAFVGATWTRASPLSPSLRLAALSTTTQTVERRAGSVAIQLRAADLSLCPVRLTLGRRVEVRPCLALELGTLRTESFRTAGAKRREPLWVAAGASARAVGRLTGVWSLELEVGAWAPADRFRYFFQPTGDTAFAVSPVGARGVLLLEATLPP